jgi:hypothetical protein
MRNSVGRDFLPIEGTGGSMSGGRDNDYLAMAKQADRAAAEAQTEIAKRSWQAIANEYRALAAEKLRLNRPDPKWDS